MAIDKPEKTEQEPKETKKRAPRGAKKADTASKDTNKRAPRQSTVRDSINDGMLNMAVRAAIEAGRIQNRNFRKEELSISSKAAGDFVTQVDKECETVILDILKKAFPDHKFLGEESGNSGANDSEYEWIIDPLDGTTNFIHGIDQFAVSIACRKGKNIILGVVYDPCRNQLFTAFRGKGAFLDGARIRVSKATILRNSLIGTGFPFRSDDDYGSYMNILKTMMESTCGLRRPGSAALDLCWLACGRYDGFFEKGIKPWDIAAGSLIAQEAGALVTDFEGNSAFLSRNEIVAATPGIFPALINNIQKNLKKD